MKMPNQRTTNPAVLVIGCSAGGLEALRVLLPVLPANLSRPVVIVAHVAHDGVSLLPSILAKYCALPVQEAREREPVLAGHVYVAPPNYHLLIEPDYRFALSVDERVCYCRPAIDLLFQAAADVYREQVVGVILTGANSDGALGLLAIKQAGGYCLVQDPEGAVAETMPRAAIATGAADQVLPLPLLAQAMLQYCCPSVINYE